LHAATAGTLEHYRAAAGARTVLATPPQSPDSLAADAATTGLTNIIPPAYRNTATTHRKGSREPHSMPARSARRKGHDLFLIVGEGRLTARVVSTARAGGHRAHRCRDHAERVRQFMHLPIRRAAGYHRVQVRSTCPSVTRNRPRSNPRTCPGAAPSWLGGELEALRDSDRLSIPNSVRSWHPRSRLERPSRGKGEHPGRALVCSPSPPHSTCRAAPPRRRYAGRNRRGDRGPGRSVMG
jgi:hypothetical protein